MSSTFKVFKMEKSLQPKMMLKKNLLLKPTRIALSKNVNGRLIVFQVLRKSAFIALDVDAIPAEIPLVLRDQIAVWFNDVEGKDWLHRSSLISAKNENKDLYPQPITIHWKFLQIQKYSTIVHENHFQNI